VALPTIEIVFEREVYDYKAKYTPGLSSHIIPARIDEAVNNRAKIEALKTYKTIGCRGFGRVDLIIDKTGTPYILEINTIPGLTPLSLFPDAAKSAGIEFPDLIEKIVMLALE
ncbi:MAG: D-alanine--D-alanine ligase, partial [Actinomycetia bacterium]|nr:D-alanine--D-alanine ligase [Actinomycetes bacterium]